MDACLKIQEDFSPKQIWQLQKINSKYQPACWYRQSLNIQPDWYFSQNEEESNLSLCFDLNDYKNIEQIQQNSKKTNISYSRIRYRRKQCHKSPFKDAKQISIITDHKLWGSNIFLSQTDQKELQYFSTTVVSSKIHHFIIKMYVNHQRIVIFNLKILDKDKDNNRQVWSYLSIYHQAIPNLDIYSLMFGWTKQQIYCFWLVRSIAFEAMLFRLAVHPISHKNYQRHRYWYLFEPADIKQANDLILRQFAQSGNWISTKPIYDYRFASHNKVQWQYQTYNWNLDAHHLLEINTQKKNVYSNHQLKKWFNIVRHLYTDFLDCHRIKLITNPQNGCLWRDKIIFSEKRTYFNFIGTIDDWAEKPIQQQLTTYKNTYQTQNTNYMIGYVSQQQDIMNDWLNQINQLQKDNLEKSQ